MSTKKTVFTEHAKNFLKIFRPESPQEEFAAKHGFFCGAVALFSEIRNAKTQEEVDRVFAIVEAELDGYIRAVKELAIEEQENVH